MMVVLFSGGCPPENMKIIQKMLALQKHSDGLSLKAHPKL
jgi:heterodisulfide reductase subunit A-like polyferredoxin